jgi:hypothetical protein
MHGVQIDSAEEPDELHAAFETVLAASPTGQGEEFAIRGYEGFGLLGG